MQPKRVFDFFQLEDRILLSGEGLEGELAENPDTALFDALLEEFESEGQATPNQFAESADVVQQSEPAENVAGGEAPAGEDIDPVRPLEVVFIDAGVEDAELLIDGIREGGSDDGVQWLVVTLSADADGVDQISETLARVSGIDAIHLVSHGDGSGIRLGNTMLTAESAAGYAGELAQWAGSLDEGADLLIYGCDLASTSEGKDLISMLATVCDCDVAASDDATGHATLGGDWILEYSVGEMETELAFGSDVQASWHSTLDITSNLVGHWELDDGSGTTADDATANNNDGTVGGTATWTSGEIGGAFEFDPSNGEDYIEIPNSATLENVQEGDYTLASWFRPDSTPPGTTSDNDAHY
ncbi:MAG: DUF4347 domain-containing protein, partial [Planctomycetota bacterium]